MQNTSSDDITDNALPPTATLRVFVTAVCLVAIGDFLLWRSVPGLSVGLFALAVCFGILTTRREWTISRNAAIGCVLLSLTVIQTSIELSFSNLLCLLLLIAMILGETSYTKIRALWARWAEGALMFARTPFVWFWALPAAKQLPIQIKSPRPLAGVVIQVVLPAVLAAAVFALLLGRGNAIFAQMISEIFSAFGEMFSGFSIGRILFWIVLVTFVLAILRPAMALLGEKVWDGVAVPFFREPSHPRIAQWRSLSILGVLNALFFAANTIDVIYLWTRGAVPAGVNYSDYVHQGVYSLIAAVLLSAIVLALLYQQAPVISASRILRFLSLAWIAQNLVLLAGVLWRLKLYVDAYQLTEQRVYVVLFLLLVATGFGFLSLRIVAAKRLEWVILANKAAVFALFFIVQFLNVSGWVAEYNVARWLREPGRTLDTEYLARLGHPAYPALIRVAETPGRPAAHEAFVFIEEQREHEREYLRSLDWRSWQFRAVRNARLLVNHEIRTTR